MEITNSGNNHNIHNCHLLSSYYVPNTANFLKVMISSNPHEYGEVNIITPMMANFISVKWGRLWHPGVDQRPI